MSPLQLYTAYSQGSSLFDETIDPDTYGVDPSDTQDADDLDGDRVVIPQIDIPLTSTSLQELSVQINPLQECNDFGKQIYIDTVHVLYTLMVTDRILWPILWLQYLAG